MTIEKLKSAYEESSFPDDWEDFKIVSEGDWENDYKDYCLRTDVVQSKETGKYYAVYRSRSGSYYSDYDYGEPDFCEVERVEEVKVVVSWKAVK